MSGLNQLRRFTAHFRAMPRIGAVDAIAPAPLERIRDMLKTRVALLLLPLTLALCQAAAHASRYSPERSNCAAVGGSYLMHVNFEL